MTTRCQVPQPDGWMCARGEHRAGTPCAPARVGGRVVPTWKAPPYTAAARELEALREWWVTTAAGDIDGSLDKLREYGGDGPAVDLLTTGDFLARACGWNDYSEQDAIELAIAFYLVSKVGRWQAAILSGQRPSDDTLLDITYYSMMARRNREVGAWPWPAGEGAPR